MRKGLLLVIAIISFGSNVIIAQQYGVCVWERYFSDTVYVSNVFEYDPPNYSYGDYNGLQCSANNALKIEIGRKYTAYVAKLHLNNSYNKLLTRDEAGKLRIKLIADFRATDHKVISINMTYDKDACNPTW